MILRFTDDYINYIFEARKIIGNIQNVIATKEPYVGNISELDRLYAQSIVITALVDHFEHDDNSKPEDNEYLLQCLKKIISKNICGSNRS